MKFKTILLIAVALLALSGCASIEAVGDFKEWYDLPS